ncbi:hypothetical protein GQ473_03875 [archaeon]|nr:hypothetical protein [archaeon]
MSSQEEISELLDKISDYELRDMDCLLYYKDIKRRIGGGFAIMSGVETYVVLSETKDPLELTSDQIYDVAKQIIVPENHQITKIHEEITDRVGLENTYYLAKTEVFKRYKEIKNENNVDMSLLAIECVDRIDSRIIPLITDNRYMGIEDFELYKLRLIIDQIDRMDEFLKRAKKY